MAYDNIKNKLIIDQTDIVGLIDTKLDATGKAASATVADSATKAAQDSDGNQINTTYLKTSTITYGTSDLTAGSSPLATGSLYFVYE